MVEFERDKSWLTLESLPNEILIHVLENYINGIDIFTAFIGQLNSRIDGLIAQCRKFRFNFICCRKDHFQFCLNLCPSLFDCITELNLSEWKTPGQIDRFLSSFSSFEVFKNLRILYFHFDTDIKSSELLRMACQSLMHLMNLCTLSIKEKGNNSYISRAFIHSLLSLPRLKRLSVAVQGRESYHNQILLPTLSPFPSNIEHLIITGVQYNWSHLQSMVRYTPHLRYFNLRLTDSNFDPYHIASLDNLPFLLQLRTLILHFEDNHSVTFKMVAQFLQKANNLCRLEITAHDALVRASSWEQLIQATLPHLNKFCLKSSSSRLKNRIISEVLLSFQTSFWTGKNSFYFIIVDDDVLLNDFRRFDHICGRYRQTYASNWRRGSNQSTQFAATSASATSTFTSLYFCGNSLLLSHQHLFNNVRYLVITHLEKNLVSWILKHVNCSKIEELDISQCGADQVIISLLLIYMKNLKSFILDINQLNAFKPSQIEANNQVRSLVLFDRTRSFHEDLIQTVGGLFPRIEHLVIALPRAAQLPVLCKYLPYLQSITFTTDEFHIKYFQWSGVFRCDGDWKFIWLNPSTDARKFQKLLVRVASLGSSNESSFTKIRRYKKFKSLLHSPQ
ncbi:unnamed protein product [Rotaria magnacalcarata]|uniref:Uncharacterized protein n=1 Tax=Rotaria magnacalcarata TaxID=392030 RepID=A0A816BZX1_9BILA|nr:unnamed protein product [Rotaria magnacalcarata]CAF1616330.1 unnamed protein product [Rotaria magnacalcarata]CAF3816438.1 unnamed protein product [Rotaria magnacalcarata]CAF3838240.1 unnamed protein product [Rotaria magnacalcarata]